MEHYLVGKEIAFTTTNGTQAIAKSVGANEILIGSFLNLSALTNYLQHITNDVLVVCAGWKGKFNLEDTLFAGAVVELMQNELHPECDAPLAAQHLYLQARSNMAEFLKNSSHVQRLARLGIERDIQFCLTPDQYNIVPVLRSGKLEVL
jgi:2-phosphosulfolactate phosphatase